MSPKKQKQSPLGKARVADTSVRARGTELQGQRVAVAVCGGIGATEVVKITREIRRHGAEVAIFVTPSVFQFIGRVSLEWAANRPVIEAPGPQVEYLDPFDAVLVVPATLNTLSKAAVGISDNGVTLLLSSFWATGRPVLIVPAMNAQMWEHPKRPEIQKTLEGWGAVFWKAPLEEDRLKVPEAESLVDWMIAQVGRGK